MIRIGVLVLLSGLLLASIALVLPKAVSLVAIGLGVFLTLDTVRSLPRPAKSVIALAVLALSIFTGLSAGIFHLAICTVGQALGPRSPAGFISPNCTRYDIEGTIWLGFCFILLAAAILFFTMLPDFHRSSGRASKGMDERRRNELFKEHLATVQELNNVLGEWRGASARFWRYEVSHSVFVLRLQRKGQRGNLHISCDDCYNICGSTGWPSASITVTATGDPDVGYFLVEDNAAGFLVSCNRVVLQRNIEPVF